MKTTPIPQGWPMDTGIVVWIKWNHCDSCTCGQWEVKDQEYLDKHKPDLYIKEGIRYEKADERTKRRW